MNEIITELSKPAWWFSVVVAGILINLFSAYLKSKIDKSLLSSLSWWREKSTKRQHEWTLRVEAIISNTEMKADEMHNEIMQELQSVSFMLLAIFMLLLSLSASALYSELPRFMLIVALGIAAFSFFVSYLAFLKATYTSAALIEAGKKLTSFKRDA